MQVEEITQILRESPSVRLIKSRSVDFFLSFVIEAFEGQAAIMQERLHMLLENRLDEQENTLVEDDSEMTRLVESNEQKAKRVYGIKKDLDVHPSWNCAAAGHRDGARIPAERRSNGVG